MEAINNMEHLLEKAKELKFKSIEPIIKELFKQARQESWSYEKCIDELFTVEAERIYQERKKSRISF